MKGLPPFNPEKKSFLLRHNESGFRGPRLGGEDVMVERASDFQDTPGPVRQRMLD